LATSGSSYELQEAAPPRKLIPVTTGLFAAGYVQISGPKIYPGLQGHQLAGMSLHFDQEGRRHGRGRIA
jgi:hypothetical protein